MKLFEVLDAGSVMPILRILRGLADGGNDSDGVREVHPSELVRLLQPFGLTVSSAEEIKDLFSGPNGLDRNNTVVKTVKDNGTLVLSTDSMADTEVGAEKGASSGSMLDRMASHNAKTIAK